MLPKPGTHNHALLAILSDGRPHSTSAILRRHPMMVHSRVSDLRKPPYNFTIVHNTVPGRRGGRGHTYQLLNPPADVQALSPDLPQQDFGFSYEELDPRGPDRRYRIYIVKDEEPVCIAACPTPAAVGVAIVEMAGEGQFDNVNFGLMDGPDWPGKWLIKPWDNR